MRLKQVQHNRHLKVNMKQLENEKGKKVGVNGGRILAALSEVAGLMMMAAINGDLFGFGFSAFL